jgi:hypothetical protein
LSYTLSEIKVAAYNYNELPDMTQDERWLWYSLAYCYEWFRAHPEDKDDCDNLAKEYIRFFWKGEKTEE